MTPFLRPSTLRPRRPGTGRPRRLLLAGILGSSMSLGLALPAAPALGQDDGPTARATAPTSAQRPTVARDADTDDGARRTARAFVEDSDLLGTAPGEGLAVASTTDGPDGARYVAYERTFRGLPVVGGDAVVAVTDTGKVIGWTAAREASVAVSSTSPEIGAGDAQGRARDLLDTVRRAGEPRLVVHALGASPRLAWQTRVRGTVRGAPSDQTVWTDARTGALIGADDLVAHGAGRGYYSGRVTIGTSRNLKAKPAQRWGMVDRQRRGVACGGTAGRPYRGPDDAWGNARSANLETACVDVLYAIAQEWSMLSQWLGRNGILGDGTGVPARVGASGSGASFVGTHTIYGRSRDKTRSLTSLDIVGHENGHAVFASMPGSAKGPETGAISESAGDIFGTLTEAYADNPRDEPDYLLGEEASPYGTGEVRDMADPARLGDPDCYTPSIADTEIHAGAGPMNHWFYLLAEGSATSATCNGGTVDGVGIRQAGRVFYEALKLKTSGWAHTDVRRATLIAAKALDGGGCATYQQVRAAWSATSVPARADEPACASGGSGGVCTQVTRSASVADRDDSFQPWSKGFPANAGTIEGCLDGPADADLDLFLQRWEAGVWSDVASSEATGSQERVSFAVEPGYYRWAVFGYAGGGSFTLSYDVP